MPPRNRAISASMPTSAALPACSIISMPNAATARSSSPTGSRWRLTRRRSSNSAKLWVQGFCHETRRTLFAIRGAIFVSALGLALAGCGSGDSASKMTSYSTGESAEAKAELFSLPADQMSHIQVVTVEQGPLARTLRLTGAVEYNDFKTTPVITQIGGPGSRVVVAPGEHVR